MFVRYEISATATSVAASNAVLADLNNVLNGTNNLVSAFTTSVCNKSLSTITGSFTGSVYSVYAFNSNTGTTGCNSIVLRKNHNSTTLGSSFMSINCTNRFAAGTANIVYRFSPNNSIVTTPAWPGGVAWYAGTGAPSAFFDDTNTSYVNSSLPSSAGNIASWCARILMWINDYNFVIQFIGVDGSMYTGGLFDYEHTASDTYAYSLNNNAVPQIYMSSIWRNMTGNSPIAASNTCGIAFGRGVYMQNNGTVSSSGTAWTTSTLDFHYGNQGNTASSLAPTIYPLPRFTQYSAPLSSGTSHLIQPVYYFPGFNNGTSSSTGLGKLPNFYRTTDDIADSGETITDSGGTTYAVLRLHKTKGYGAADFANQTPNACYLIPV